MRPDLRLARTNVCFELSVFTSFVILATSKLGNRTRLALPILYNAKLGKNRLVNVFTGLLSSLRAHPCLFTANCVFAAKKELVRALSPKRAILRASRESGLNYTSGELRLEFLEG